jgi:tetratricopeptide (TPR) repeat protein
MLQLFAKARAAYLNEEGLAAIERIGNPEDYVWVYLGVAKSYLAEGALAEAEEHLAKAQDAAGATSSAFMRGHLALTRGSVYQRRGAWDAAESQYAEADRSFREIGDGGHVPGIVDCMVNLGLLAVDRNEQDRAVEIACRCGEVSKQCGYDPAYARGLLLKSVVLAEYDGDRDDLFEDVLRCLDSITCPATMFKVVANIYHYGRKFKSFDLDVRLEAKLNELREVLDQSVYDELKRTYFDSRFAQRILEHLTKGSPPDDTD